MKAAELYGVVSFLPARAVIVSWALGPGQVQKAQRRADTRVFSKKGSDQCSIPAKLCETQWTGEDRLWETYPEEGMWPAWLPGAP